VFLQLQFLRLRANFGVYFMLEAYFDLQSLYLVEKNSGKFIYERRSQKYKSTKIFRRFSDVTILRGGTE